MRVSCRRRNKLVSQRKQTWSCAFLYVHFLYIANRACVRGLEAIDNNTATHVSVGIQQTDRLWECLDPIETWSFIFDQCTTAGNSILCMKDGDMSLIDPVIANDDAVCEKDLSYHLQPPCIQ